MPGEEFERQWGRDENSRYWAVDPVDAKFAQLMFAELIGAVAFLGGVYSSFRNLSGKSHLVFEGGGIAVRLKNATPGAIVAPIGLGAIWMSLDSKIVREETIITEPQPSSPEHAPPAASRSAPTEQPPAVRKERKTTRTEVFMKQERSIRQSWEKLWGKDDKKTLERVH